MKTNRKLIALSAGENNEELAAQGIGTEHIDELLIRFSMRLLRDGHRLSFGGSLGEPDKPLTQHLIDTALRWLDDEEPKGTEVSKPETWPLLNYSGWPYYTSINAEVRALQVGVCQFINVPPENVSSEELDSLIKDWKENPVARKRNADSLSLMRKKSAEQASLRIVWGGKIQGASGWMAGILEEVAYTLEFEKPLLLLGGFGGCSKLIADFLSDPKRSWPSALSLQTSSDTERDKLLSRAEKQKLWDRFEKTKANLKDFRKLLHSKKTVNGIASKALVQGLDELSPRELIHLGADVAKNLKVETKTRKE